MDVERFIFEDLGYADITSDALLGNQIGSAKIIANEAGVVAGVSEAEQIFSYFGLQTLVYKTDGTKINAGDIILEVNGTLKSILSAERTALNFMMRMSGIATTTHELVSRLSHAKVAATRKTTPGFREFEKKAVILGGGDCGGKLFRWSGGAFVLLFLGRRSLGPLL